MGAAAGLVGFDAGRLMLGHHKDKNWKQTLGASYKGLIGLGALPVLYGANKFYNREPDPEEYGTEEKLSESDNSTVIQGKKIIGHARVLSQYGANCGYHAIYNALGFVNKQISLTDEEEFETRLTEWKQTVENGRRKQLFGQAGTRQTGTSNINSGEIETIIQNHVPTLAGEPLCKNVSTIDCLDMMKKMIEQGAIAGTDRHTVNNIARFRKYKEPQIVILNSSSGDVYTKHAASWHWFAVKIEHGPNDMVSMTIADSLGSYYGKTSLKDYGYNDTILEKLRYLFVEMKLPSNYSV